MQQGLHWSTLRKKPGGSNPPGSESSRSLCDPCRPLSTAANAGGVTFLKRRTSSPLVAALFPAVNADGTTMTCPRVGIPLCRALLGGGQKRAAGNVSSFLSPPFFLALRSSVEAGPHKPVCEGSTPSAATTRSPRRATKRSEVNVPESSNGRTRGFDPRDEGSTPSSGAKALRVQRQLRQKVRAASLGLRPRGMATPPSSGADKHLGVAQSGESARFGTERLRVRILPPRLTRGSSSGDGSCLTNRLRRVRSSRPVPTANVAQSAEAAASNPAS
jgi:hypothetical protein